MWVTDTVEFPHKAGGGGSREISVGVKDSTYPSFEITSRCYRCSVISDIQMWVTDTVDLNPVSLYLLTTADGIDDDETRPCTRVKHYVD